MLPPLAAKHRGDVRLSADPEVADGSLFDHRRPLERELETGLDPNLTTDVIAVGDCISSRPLSQYARADESGRVADPGFRAVLDLLTAAGTRAVQGNFETVVFDPRTSAGAPHSWAGDWPLSSLPAVPADLAAMGFTLLARANNHAFDWGPEGARDSSAALDRAGIAHAGVGDTLGLARAAAFQESPVGRFALVSCTSTFRETTDALPARGAAPARAGVSGLTVHRRILLPDDLFELAGRLAARLPPERPSAAPTQGESIRLFGQTFVRAGGPDDPAPRHTYEIDPDDLAGVLHCIREAKQHSDFVIAAVHAHEEQAPEPDAPPPDFLPRFAHAAVDAGADLVAVTGTHRLGAVELHRGRPVFYGLGDFIWSDIQQPLPHDLYARNAAALHAAFRHPSRVTDADLSNLINAGAGFSADSLNSELVFTGILGRCRFRGPRLEAVDVFPIDLGWPPRPLTRSGIPRLATGDRAGRVLERLAAISAPFGTEIEIAGTAGGPVGRVRLV